ncbi:MAG: site-2 protease family protein [Patescibacteria group bacterium]|jgi:Zn-dependent protease
MVIAILVALTVHEFSHALAATLLGDQTAKRMGRLTLNPFAHIDIFGFLALVFVGFGWGKPVPYNPYNLKNRRWGSIIVGIAGPISNFIFLALSALLLHLTAPIFGGKYLIVFLAYLFQFNVILMLFNLIPIPPLDGSKVVIALLDQPKYLSVRNQYETYGPWALMILILAEALLGLNIFGYILNTPYSWIIDLFRMN